MSKLFTVATWNVNSVRVRLKQLLDWLATKQPDVLALQETKVENKNFPQKAFLEAGYYVESSGQKTYNGVALISRIPMDHMVAALPDFTDTQRRLLAASIGPVRIVNVYVPNGASIDSDKYHYKLKWLAQLQTYLQKELNQHHYLIVLGDFNIAPQDKDVHDPKAWENKVLVSPQERQSLKEMMGLGLKDSFRLFHSETGHYSWWDYRAAAFRRNQGLRIDHILSSDALVPYCTDCKIDKIVRQWEKPSDHAPVIATYQGIS